MPRHGAPAEWALEPLNLKIAEISAFEPDCPHDTPRSLLDVREQRDVDVLEHAGANEERLARHLLLGHAGPEDERAGDLARAP